MPRIVTWNVHRCVGSDRRLDVDRIAAALAQLNPDIVALQELDARTRGSKPQPRIRICRRAVGNARARALK